MKFLTRSIYLIKFIKHYCLINKYIYFCEIKGLIQSVDIKFEL